MDYGGSDIESGGQASDTDSTSQPDDEIEDDRPATGGDDGPATGGDDFSGCPSDCESDTAGARIYVQTRLRVRL